MDNIDKDTLSLMIAVKKKFYDIAKLLIEKGVDINFINSEK